MSDDKKGKKMIYFIFFATAGEPKADYEIVVNAHRDFEVYVAPIKVINNTKKDYKIDPLSIFNSTCNSAKYARVKSDYGYEDIGSDLKIYNEDTIKYSWDECNYSKNPKECTYQNGHYLLESQITINNDEILINITLYNEDLVPIAQSAQTNSRVRKIIERQKKTNETGSSRVGGLAQNCSGTSCPIRPAQNGSVYSQRTVEDLEPTIINIDPQLTYKDIYQASMSLWVGLKLN